MTPFQPFYTHIALALQLIALVSGILLINKASSEGFFCKKTGKIVGGLVAIVSILSIVCIVTLTVKRCCHREKGMSPMMWQHPPMMEHPGEHPGEKVPETK